MPHDPTRLLLNLRSALLKRAGPAGLKLLGLPWLVTLAVLLGGGNAEPRLIGRLDTQTPQPPEQSLRTQSPGLERHQALPERHLREGLPPLPWPDLPPGWPGLTVSVPGTLTATNHTPGARAAQRLAQWGKWQLEGG